MKSEMTAEKTVIDFCERIGANRLLVQGAGGNVSWKDGDTLWVKASGTKLADAKKDNIFVPVNLKVLHGALKKRQFDIKAESIADTGLRPSIETVLHALMPYKFVVHLHAVEVLAHIVRKEWHSHLASVIDNDFVWAAVGYKKPGAELAEAVSEALSQKQDINVIILANHGVVVGSDSISDVESILETLTTMLKTHPIELTGEVNRLDAVSIHGKQFQPVNNNELHELAVNPTLFARLQTDWALYPDHVVFLGGQPCIFNDLDQLNDVNEQIDLPDLIFVKDIGVYTSQEFSHAKLEQLQCYFDVLVRQHEGSQINTLNQHEIAQLVDWDAEKYRMTMSK